MKLAGNLNQIHPYTTPAFDAGFTCYMQFGDVVRYALFSLSTSLENIKKVMHRTEVAIKNLNSMLK